MRQEQIFLWAHQMLLLCLTFNSSVSDASLFRETPTSRNPHFHRTGSCFSRGWTICLSICVGVFASRSCSSHFDISTSISQFLRNLKISRRGVFGENGFFVLSAPHHFCVIPNPNKSALSIAKIIILKKTTTNTTLFNVKTSSPSSLHDFASTWVNHVPPSSSWSPFKPRVYASPCCRNPNLWECSSWQQCLHIDDLVLALVCGVEASSVVRAPWPCHHSLSRLSSTSPCILACWKSGSIFNAASNSPASILLATLKHATP